MNDEAARKKAEARDSLEEIESDAFLEEIPEDEELMELISETEPSNEPIWEGLTDRDTGMARTLKDLAGSDVSATGGDIETDQYLAEVSGEEAVGGTTSTPDQNIVDELASSAGVEIDDKRTLHISEMVEQRDEQRWELDAESAEDYPEHEQKTEESL
jgi:Family of unknown function (DUF6335)